MSDEALLAAVNARGEESGRKSSLQTLLATGVLFLALGGLSWGWESVVYIALAVVLHELGHVFAMRHFGYKNVRMLFLPMFGGLATGEPRELDATKNAAVAIAGPVFGLASVLVAGVAAMWLESSSWLVEFAWVSLFLNAFNLLPLVPLDGGQFTNDVLFSRYPAMELGFRILAMAALAWIAITFEMWLLGFLVFSMLASTPFAYRRATLIRQARQDSRWATRELDRQAIGELREVAAEIFKNAPARETNSPWPERVHGVWLEIRKQFPPPKTTAILLIGYAGLCAMVVPALGFFLVHFFPRPAF